MKYFLALLFLTFSISTFAQVRKIRTTYVCEMGRNLSQEERGKLEYLAMLKLIGNSIGQQFSDDCSSNASNPIERAKQLYPEYSIRMYDCSRTQFIQDPQNDRLWGATVECTIAFEKDYGYINDSLKKEININKRKIVEQDSIIQEYEQDWEAWKRKPKNGFLVGYQQHSRDFDNLNTFSFSYGYLIPIGRERGSFFKQELIYSRVNIKELSKSEDMIGFGLGYGSYKHLFNPSINLLTSFGEELFLRGANFGIAFGKRKFKIQVLGGISFIDEKSKGFFNFENEPLYNTSIRLLKFF